MEVKLKEIIRFQPGYAFKKTQMGNVGLNLIKIKSLKNNKVILESSNTKIEESDALKDHLIFKDDILMALTGDPVNKGNYETWVGRTSRYTNNQKAYLNQRICKLIPNENLINKWYLYYWLIRYDKTYEIASLCHGSANQANISHKDVGELTIDLPSIEIQNKIAKILYDIDKKIELNNHINDNLYEIGASLVNKYFAETNDYQVLDNIIKFNKGKKPKDISEIKMDNYIKYLTIACLNGQELNYANTDKTLIADNDLLMVMDGARSGDIYYSDYGIVGSTLAKIEILDESIEKEYIYFCLKKYNELIKSKNTGSAIPHTDKVFVSSLEIPNIDSEKKQYFKVLLKNIQENEKENKTLEQLRDTLLPRLMNGEIDIENIEI